MKAVVVEIKDKYVAVMSDDGVVSKLENNNFKLGQVISMKEKNNIINIGMKKIAVLASAAAVVLVSSIGTYAYNKPVSYVSLDVNPSIGFSFNTFGKVIDVTGVNDDGEKILTDLDLKNKDIETAIRETVDELIKQGYIANDENGGIIITASNNNDNMDNANEMAQALQEKVQQQITEEEKTATVEAFGVGRQRVEEARELGVTPGKLNLVQKLQASSADPDSIELDEWLNKSVKEINKAIKENKKNAKKNAEDTPAETTVTSETEISQTETAVTSVTEVSTDETTVTSDTSAKTSETAASVKNKAVTETTKKPVTDVTKVPNPNKPVPDLTKAPHPNENKPDVDAPKPPNENKPEKGNQLPNKNN